MCIACVLFRDRIHARRTQHTQTQNATRLKSNPSHSVAMPSSIGAEAGKATSSQVRCHHLQLQQYLMLHSNLLRLRRRMHFHVERRALGSLVRGCFGHLDAVCLRYVAQLCRFLTLPNLPSATHSLVIASRNMHARRERRRNSSFLYIHTIITAYRRHTLATPCHIALRKPTRFLRSTDTLRQCYRFKTELAYLGSNESLN